MNESIAEACRVLGGSPLPSPFQRAQLAAPILAKWCDPAEHFTAGRAESRIEKALQLADLLWAAANAPEPVAHDPRIYRGEPRPPWVAVDGECGECVVCHAATCKHWRAGVPLP